ncbi:MAG: hypothetical protein MJE68_08170 [Proteobacteria bacterium]|nr:hypothetical protein [Pseudomonadota bacterium]
MGGRQSTALATEAEHIIGNVIDFNEELVEMHRLRDGSKVRWYTTNSKKLSLLIANTLYNHKKPNITIITKRSMSKTRSEIRKNLMKLLERNLKRKPKCLKKMRLIYLVDTGGQPQFQEIMPIFIRGSSVHFLVHKLNEGLGDRPKFDYEINGVKYAVPESMMITNKVYLEQSLRTISSCTFSRTIECRTSSRIPKPHFAVIGMFKDKCESSLIDSKQEAVHKCIQPFTESGNCVAFTPSRHTDKPIYAVDGSEQGWATNDKIIEDLHVNIENFTESLKVKIPIRWFLFLNLLKDASKDQYFISRAECRALAEKEDIMMDNEDVEKALELFDELNLVLYFSKILPHIVFISPSFLFNKVSEVIVQSFDCISEDSGATAQERYDYRKTGILDKGLLSRVKSFQQDFGSGFTQDDLFKLLTELCIVAKISPSQFFVPCVLALEHDDENSKYLQGIIFDMDTASIERLVISFSDDYSPRGLFCASVAFLAKLPHWKIDSDSTSGMLKRNLIGFRVHEWNRDLTLLGNVVIVDRLSRFEIYTTCEKKHLCDIRRTVSKALWYAAAKCLAYSPENIDISTGFLCETCDQPKLHGTRVLDKDDPQWSMRCIKNRSKRPVKLNSKQLPWFSTSDFIDECKYLYRIENF